MDRNKGCNDSLKIYPEMVQDKLKIQKKQTRVNFLNK